MHDLADLAVSYSLINRDNLADKIEKYWVGRKTTHVGLQYLELRDDGRVYRSGYGERKDVVHVLTANCSLFIEPDGRVHLDSVEGRISETEREYVMAACKVIVEREHDHIGRNRRWLEAKPWEAVVGMTAEEAVAKLRQYGS